MTVTVTGKLVDTSAHGVTGASVHALSHYKTTVPICDGGPTAASGTTSFARDISRATTGYQVVIDVTFTVGGQNYNTSATFVAQ